MKLYTSYYYQLRFFPKNLIALNTTIWPPKYVQLGQKDKRGVILIDCPPLKPGIECEGLCNGKCNPQHPQDCSFLKTYYNQLSKINFEKFLFHLKNLRIKIEQEENLTNINFAFIVFEAPTKQCSERWMIHKWIKEHNLNIQEWNKMEVNYGSN